MTYGKTALYTAIILGAVASTALAQQNPAPPTGPFRAVHLMNMTAEQEAKYMAFVKEANQQFAKLGCAACAYHVYKVGAAGGGKYDHMQVSEWPGRDVYMKLHTDADFRAIDKKHPIRAEVEKSEFYDRFVEVK
jgi:hypothetical protein